LNKANDLTKSVEGKTPSRFAKSPSTQAPYKMARKASTTAAAPKGEIADTAESLKDQNDNVNAYKNAQ
jgi:hypothetical protein